MQVQQSMSQVQRKKNPSTKNIYDKYQNNLQVQQKFASTTKNCKYDIKNE